MKTIEVVCAIIENAQGEVWIGCRKSNIADGIWEFPGGKVEQGETKEAACIREIREELGCEIALDGFFMDFIDDAFSPMVHVSAYRAHMIKGTPILLAHKQGQWVPPETLYEYQFQAADHCLLDALNQQSISISQK